MTKHETKKLKKSTTFVRLMKLVFVRNKLPLILVLIFMVVSTIANVSGLNTLQNVMDEALRMYEVGSTDFSGIIKLLGMMVLFYVINISFTFAHLRLMVHVSQNSLVHLRTSLFDHMMDLPLKYFDSNKHGDIMSRFTNDVDATRQMVSQSLPQLTVSFMLMAGYFIAMLAISWVLGLFTLVFAIILIGITRIISKRTRKYFNAQQKNTGLLNGYIEEMIEGQKVVKVFRHEQEAIEGFGMLNEKVKDSARISMTRSGMLIPISINLGFLGFALTAIFGGMLVLNGYLSVSGLVLYLIFTRQFMGPVNQMSQQLNFVQMALAGASRVFEVMDLRKRN